MKSFPSKALLLLILSIFCLPIGLCSSFSYNVLLILWTSGDEIILSIWTDMQIPFVISTKVIIVFRSVSITQRFRKKRYTICSTERMMYLFWNSHLYTINMLLPAPAAFNYLRLRSSIQLITFPEDPMECRESNTSQKNVDELKAPTLFCHMSSQLEVYDTPCYWPLIYIHRIRIPRLLSFISNLIEEWD